MKAQVLFTLSWFHALIQERRTYIPQGWSKYYEFSYGDLKAGETMLLQIMENKPIQWQMVYGVLELAIYGGRVDNNFDLKVLRCYMNQFFNEQTLRGSQKI